MPLTTSSETTDAPPGGRVAGWSARARRRAGGAGSEGEGEREAMGAPQVLHVGVGVVEVRHASDRDREVEPGAARDPLGVVVDVVAAAQKGVLVERVLGADVEPLGVVGRMGEVE